jgi:hypothetical protein
MEAMKLRIPAIATGFQSMTFMNSPAMLQRNAVAAIAEIPTLFLMVSLGYCFRLSRFPESMICTLS